IREAISQGDFFIACFSIEYYSRSKTYMNEELILAVEELRQRHPDYTWFIPVLLSRCDIPKLSIGAGDTLHSIQWVALYENWDAGLKSILTVIQPATVEKVLQPTAVERQQKDLNILELLYNYYETDGFNSFEYTNRQEYSSD